MIKASRNQIGNLHNPFQTSAKRLLCVCSAGMLRSPTMANVLHKEYGYNTRSCGSCESFALIPISEALILWADEIVFTNESAYGECSEAAKELLEMQGPVIILNIPDDFSWDDLELVWHIKEQYV